MFQVVEVKFMISNAEAPKPRIVKAFEKRHAAKEYADRLNRKHDHVSMESITNYHVRAVV